MKKILSILGMVVRLAAVFFLIAVIAGISYTTYFYAAPENAPRPVDMEKVSKDLYKWMLPYQRAAPPAEPQTIAPQTAKPAFAAAVRSAALFFPAGPAGQLSTSGPDRFPGFCQLIEPV